MRLQNFAFALPVMLAASWALAVPGDEYGYGHMWGGSYGMMGGGLLMLVFLGVIIAISVIAVRWLSENGRSSGSSALNILEERFARGEIDEEEFARRKAALKG